MMIFSVTVRYSVFWFVFFQVIGIWGCILSCIFCFRSQNLKLIVALSSVRHMRLGVRFFFCLREISYDLILINCVSHGLCASGLFAWSGSQYGRSSTQNLVGMRGGRLLRKDVSLMIFLLLVLNRGIPPFISFWVELLGFITLILKWEGLWFFLVLISLLRLIFSRFIGFNFFFSVVTDGGSAEEDWRILEKLGLIMHWLPGLILFIFSYVLLW